jgi:tRNA nucleotidyltransferase (CCA-adding enzyme)
MYELRGSSYIPKDITLLSIERIREEFNKILVCERPKFWIEELRKYGFLEQIIPEISICIGFEQNNPYHYETVYDHILSVIEKTEPVLEVRLAALFHDIGKPNCYTDDGMMGHFYGHHKESADICRRVMTRLKYSNSQIEYVSELVYWHMLQFDKYEKKYAKTILKNLGAEKVDDFFSLKVADISGTKPPHNLELGILYRLKFQCDIILREKLPFQLKDLSVDGRDMMALGYSGKEIGEILDLLLNVVLEDETKNDREVLLDIAANNRRR